MNIQQLALPDILSQTGMMIATECKAIQEKLCKQNMFNLYAYRHVSMQDCTSGNPM